MFTPQAGPSPAVQAIIIGQARSLTGNQSKDVSMANMQLVDPQAAMGTDEARRISLRTREALAAYKADMRVSRRIRATYPDGVPGEVVEAVAGKLGASLPQCRNLTQEARLKGARMAGLAHKMQANEAYIDLAPWMVEMRGSGRTLQQIADVLNVEGHTTRRGAAWNRVQVWRVLDRIQIATKVMA